jgi:[1-hydroxy-2-(trimethylamino)ethyl]phosphonate dioxygenase
MQTPSSIVEEVLLNFRERGHRHYGESVTEQQHALQCATFAQRNGESPALVVACLLHDYGHLLHDLGEDIAEKGVDARHEDVGANRLKRHFIDEIVEPVRLHVEAKRYLCWKEADYLAGLSAASLQSLHLQGGPMTDAEAREFEKHPHYDAAVRLRRYDDMGKVTDMATPDIAEFRGLIESFVRKAA